jgi:nitrogen regulatory protein P-II 1
VPKIKIEIVVPSNKLDQVVNTITKSSETGKVGDGKIFITNVDQAIRIRTGETQDDAL